jgi:hypothetical protein
MIGYSGRKRACRKHELDGYREDEESQLTERLRNLSRTPSDAERVGKGPEKLKSYHEYQPEHSRGGEHGHTLHARGAQKL